MSTFSGFTAPRFTEEELERELSAMSCEERLRAERDVKGVDDNRNSVGEQMKNDLSGRQAIVSTSVNDSTPLTADVRNALNDLGPIDRAVVEEAMKCCPDEFSDNRLHQFMMSESNDSQAAAQRIAAYWKQRNQLFGSPPRPITLETDLRSEADQYALGLGVLRVLPHTDANKRMIMFYEPSRFCHKSTNRRSMMKVMWYMYEVMLKDPRSGNGVVLLVGARELTYDCFDRKLSKFHLELGRLYLPFRLCALHLVEPRSRVFDLLKPLLYFLMGQELRRRLRTYEPHLSYIAIVDALADCGMTAEVLPTEVGGDVQLEHIAWVRNRREMELVPSSTT